VTGLQLISLAAFTHLFGAPLKQFI